MLQCEFIGRLSHFMMVYRFFVSVNSFCIVGHPFYRLTSRRSEATERSQGELKKTV